MEKRSPFITVAILGAAALLLAFVAKSIGNSDGAQFLVVFATAFFAGYAASRIAYDLVPARYIKGRRQGRS